MLTWKSSISVSAAVSLLAARGPPDESSLRQRLMSQLTDTHASSCAALARAAQGMQLANSADMRFFGRAPPSTATVAAAQAPLAQALLASGSVQPGKGPCECYNCSSLHADGMGTVKF